MDDHRRILVAGATGVVGRRIITTVVAEGSNVVDDEALRASEWIPLFASAIGAPEPRHVPASPMGLLAGEAMVKRMTAQRGASNERVKRVIGWRPAYTSFREGLHHLADTVSPRPSLNDLVTAAYHAGHGHAS